MIKIYYIDNNTKVTQEFLPEGVTCLSSAEYLAKEKDETDQLVVLCEIDINTENKTVNRTDFWGISFVQELRRKNYKNKVLFVSFLSEEYFKDKVLNAKILFFPGHSFLPLPAPPQEWFREFNTFDSLTDLSLYDIKHHCCGIEQIIDEQFHSLTSKYNASKNLTPELIYAGKNLVKLVFNSLNRLVPELDSIFYPDNSGKEVLMSLRQLCESALPESVNMDYDITEPKWKYWKVLWLDDEENIESPLYKELVRRLGHEDKVILCDTYEDAVKHWEVDKAYGEISLVICDYRLKDKDGLPTSKQGYDFMKYLATDGRSVGKVVYSGLKRKFLIESFRHYGILINIYSKIDFNQHNADDLAFLADEIIRLGDNHWIEINNAPQASEWDTIAPTYHTLKNGFSFYTFQNYISRLAKQNLDIFIVSFNDQSTKKGLWNLSFVDPFTVRTGSFPDGDLTKTDAIKDILIARRFAIGLYAFLKSEKNMQSSFLHRENYLDYIKVILYNSSVNGKGYDVDGLSDTNYFTKIKQHSTLKLIPKFNAFTFDSTWPLGLLPEEFGWLKFDMGLVKESFDEIYQYLRQVQIIKNSFQLLFSEKHFNDLICKEDGTIKVSHGKIHFNDDNIPLIRNTTDAKRLVQAVYDCLSINDFAAHKHFISFWRRLVSQLNKGEFKESGLLSDFLYYITKTLKATKLDFSIVTDELLRIDSDKVKILFEKLLIIAPKLRERAGDKIDTKSLTQSEEEFKQLSPYSKDFLKNVLKAMLKPNQDKEASIFLIEVLEVLNDNNVEGFIAIVKASPFSPPYSTYSLEQEYIVRHCPWEISYPKHRRLVADFLDVSNELFEAIELKDLSYTHNHLENRNNIWSDTITDFIRVYHDTNNPNKYLDIYFRAVTYARSRGDLYIEQKLTDNRNRSRKSGDELSATEYAENKLARKSYEEQIEYYNSQLDEDPSLRLDYDNSEDSDQGDIW